MQDVFLMIWRHPERYPSTGDSLAGFLTVVARNRSIDVIRRRRHSEPIEDFSLRCSFDLAHHAEQNLMFQKVQVASMRLSPQQRKMIDLAFLREMTHAEISAATGCPLGTVKSRIRSALLSLRVGIQAGYPANRQPTRSGLVSRMRQHVGNTGTTSRLDLEAAKTRLRELDARRSSASSGELPRLELSILEQHRILIELEISLSMTVSVRLLRFQGVRLLLLLFDRPPSGGLFVHRLLF